MSLLHTQPTGKQFCLDGRRRYADVYGEKYVKLTF